MVKTLLAGVALSLLLAGPGMARKGAAAEGVLAIAEPGEVQQVQPPVAETREEAEAKEQPVEYKFGLAGFLRGEGAGNFRAGELSYQPGHREGRFLYRVKPFAVWNPLDYAGITLEGQAYGFTGGGGDDWSFSLYQGYLDLKLPGSDLVALRAGRQEFNYGSAFMLGPDSFYDGLSFDAARLRVQPAGPLTIDLLGGRYASPWANGTRGNLFGAYASLAAADGSAAEGYLLSDSGSAEHHRGEVLNSVGLRGVQKLGPLTVELEPVYQFGRLYNAGTGGNEEISAWGGHLDLAAEFKTGQVRHRFLLGYAAGSGSRSAAEGGSARREFRNPDNDSALVGDISVFTDLSGLSVAGHHASGLQIVGFGWIADLTPALNLSATGHYFRAGAVEAGFSRDLGLEADLILTYTLSDQLTLLLAYDRLFTGSFFRDASGQGDDVHYGYAMLQFNLEKAKPKAPKGKETRPAPSRS